MPANTDKLKEELRETLASLISLRDEIRVQVHLANQDAKGRWRSLEEELHSVQVAAVDASEKSLSAVRQAMKDFQVSLKASHEANKQRPH